MARSILVIISCLIFVIDAQIQEPREYAATAVPQDTSLARQVLGYNKYDSGRTVQGSDKSILYGNNWEQYVDPNQIQPQFQNQYYQNDRYY